MKAIVFNGPCDVSVNEVPDPRIEHPADAIVRITTTNICGSDLHMYEGRAEVDHGKILGHENMGIVEEVGDGVDWISVGDRVSVPFNVSCGTCENCTSGWTSFCLRTNPTDGVDGAAYGYAQMGPYDGGQAEYLRVPFADFNLLPLPLGDDFERDFTMLSDIFPTGYHGCELADVGPGHTVAVFGAGPVGLMAAHNAFIRGASRVFVVDKEADRLRLAESIDADPIDFSSGDPVEQIIEANGGPVDRGVEAVGFQAHDPTGEQHPELVLDNLVKVVRSTGALGVVGVYVPQDPGGPRTSRSGAGSPGSTASSSRRVSAWVPASARSSATTVFSATCSSRGVQGRRSSFRTSCHSPKHPRRTGTSMNGSTAGRRCSCTRRPDITPRGSAAHRRQV